MLDTATAAAKNELLAADCWLLTDAAATTDLCYCLLLDAGNVKKLCLLQYDDGPLAASSCWLAA